MNMLKFVEPISGTTISYPPRMDDVPSGRSMVR